MLHFFNLRLAFEETGGFPLSNDRSVEFLLCIYHESSQKEPPIITTGGSSLCFHTMYHKTIKMERALSRS